VYKAYHLFYDELRRIQVPPYLLSKHWAWYSILSKIHRVLKKGKCNSKLLLPSWTKSLTEPLECKKIASLYALKKENRATPYGAASQHINVIKGLSNIGINEEGPQTTQHNCFLHSRLRSRLPLIWLKWVCAFRWPEFDEHTPLTVKLESNSTSYYQTNKSPSILLHKEEQTKLVLH